MPKNPDPLAPGLSEVHNARSSPGESCDRQETAKSTTWVVLSIWVLGPSYKGAKQY